MLIALICPMCKAEIPDDSKFCLSCGRPLTAEDLDMILPPDGSHTEGRATMYLMLAIMSLFFGIFLLVPGYFVGLGMLMPAVCLIVAGVILLVARYIVLKRYAEKVLKLRNDAAVRVTCSYCGSLNSRSNEKCEICGAPFLQHIAEHTDLTIPR